MVPDDSHGKCVVDCSTDEIFVDERQSVLLLFKNLPISSGVFFFQEKDDHRGGNSWLREDLAHQGDGL